MFDTLDHAIGWLESQLKFKPKSDLDRMRAAFALAGIDAGQLIKIHVAGTNGKGSVCAYVGSILDEAGYRAGIFTSPYLRRFNERIRIGLEDIPDGALLTLINRIHAFDQRFLAEYGETLAFFELLFLLAMTYFTEEAVDVIVMEVGLGGLLDATNILDYDVSLITSIGFDHMKQLGDTLESIAYNKLGILKPGNHLITTVDLGLHDYFKEHLARLDHVTGIFYTQDDVRKISDLPLVFVHEGETYQVSLLGDFQMLNALLAVKAVRHLFPDITPDMIKKGLGKATWPGRLQRMDQDKLIYLDGAHNAHALEALAKTMPVLFPDHAVWVLFSALADKDIKGMLAIISRFASTIVLTSFPDSRFVSLLPYQQPGIAYIDDPLEAIENMKAAMDEKTVLLMTGSLHFAGYLSRLLTDVKRR